MPCPVHRLQKNQAMHTLRRCAVELTFCRRYAFTVFAAVVRAEQSHIDVASVDFIQVKLIRSLVGCRNVLEQKHLEEPADQRVVVNVVPQSRSFACELTLRTADEDAEGGAR